jgi:hypothetical protein
MAHKIFRASQRKKLNGGANSIMIYCKNSYKCYIVPPVQQNKKRKTLFLME